MSKGPTKKQRELLTFIENFMARHGFSPSYREIMRSLSYASVSTVATHINNLIILGYLQKTEHSARSLEVTNQVGDDYENPSIVKPSQEKWLVDMVKARFKAIEKKKPSSKEIDDLFVLVGALHVLGLEDVAKSYKIKLIIISNQTD